MKKFVVFLFFAFVLTVPTAASLEISEYNITFDISPDGSVMEEISMSFREKVNRSELNYIVLGDVSDISVSDGSRSTSPTLPATHSTGTAIGT